MPIVTVISSTPTATVTSSDAVSPNLIPALVAFRHQQEAASDEWVIVHNLGFYPNVTVLDSGGSMVEGAISYTNVNSLTVNFSATISGTASLS